MTGKPKPVDPWPIEVPRKTNRATQGPGLSEELVEAIYDQVLGVEPTSPTTPQLRIPKAIVDEVHQDVMSGGGTTRRTTGQFNKGTSGNPKGRPRRAEPSQAVPPSALAAESLSAIALRQAARTIKAQTEQGEIELTVVEAAFTRMVREAIKGNTGHSRTLMQQVARAEAEEAKRKREVFRHWSAVKEQAAQLYLEAERAGKEPPLSVHPDDIELSTDGTVAIVGPTAAENIAEIRRIESMVDYHIVNIAYHQWVDRRWTQVRGKRVNGCLYAELDFWDQQNDLPPRLKLTIDEVNARLQSYAGFSGRALHGFLGAKAARHGLDAPPREARMPLIVPTEVLEFAKANKISTRRLLPMWLDAESRRLHQKLDEYQAASRHTPHADTLVSERDN